MTRQFTLAAVFLLICSIPPRAQQKSGPPVVVQVAVHYGPLRDALLSGVVVNDGQAILSEAAAFQGAQEILVAYTDSEIVEVPVGKMQTQDGIGLLPLAQRHGQGVALAGADATPPSEFDAFAGGAPQSFEAVLTAIHLKRSSGVSRWQVTPRLPAHFRGGPILDSQNRLLGILLLDPQGAELVGIPVALFGSLLLRPGAAPPDKGEARRPSGPAVKSATPANPVPAPGVPPPSLPDLQLPLPAPAIGWLWRGAAPPGVPQGREHPAHIDAAQPAQESRGETSPAPPASLSPELAAIQTANEQIQNRNYGGAVATLEAALREHPNAVELHYHLAYAYWYRSALKPDGKLRGAMDRVPFRKALMEFETFLREAPEDPRAADARVRLELLRRARYGSRSKDE